MGEPLKNFFNPDIVKRIAGMIAAVHPAFPTKAFISDATKGLTALELVPRARHIARALHKHLSAEYMRAARILKASLGPPLETTEGNGLAPFLYLPHVIYVSEYGLEDLETSLDLQYELTKRFSAEFSIRAFIERYPQKTMARLREWARDPDVHVRRLVSEGTRPRLPWASRLRAFQENPAPVLALLELLKDDPDLYVRRSVANNLNDIGKDHPEILFATCERWLQGASPEREWLVRHALRSSVKRAESGAMRVVGFERKAQVACEKIRITPRRPRIGERVEISLELVSRARSKQTLLVDLRVHFVKSSGGTGAKVFKLAQLELPTRGRAPLALRLSLRQMTTRRHYPGKHTVEAVINGATFPLGSFVVTGV